MTQQKLFCHKCGCHLTMRHDKYSEYTGEAIVAGECHNSECHIGCLNMGGHYHASWWRGGHCKRCGSVQPHEIVGDM